MTKYTRRCTNGRRCPNTPSCGLDCHFDTAQDHDDNWILDRNTHKDKEPESIGWAVASALTAGIAVAATIIWVMLVAGAFK